MERGPRPREICGLLQRRRSEQGARRRAGARGRPLSGRGRVRSTSGPRSKTPWPTLRDLQPRDSGPCKRIVNVHKRGSATRRSRSCRTTPQERASRFYEALPEADAAGLTARRRRPAGTAATLRGLRVAPGRCAYGGRDRGVLDESGYRMGARGRGHGRGASRAWRTSRSS
jgi:hypothetical protein